MNIDMCHFVPNGCAHSLDGVEWRPEVLGRVDVTVCVMPSCAISFEVGCLALNMSRTACLSPHRPIFCLGSRHRKWPSLT